MQVQVGAGEGAAAAAYWPHAGSPLPLKVGEPGVAGDGWRVTTLLGLLTSHRPFARDGRAAAPGPRRQACGSSRRVARGGSKGLQELILPSRIRDTPPTSYCAPPTNRALSPATHHKPRAAPSVPQPHRKSPAAMLLNKPVLRTQPRGLGQLNAPLIRPATAGGHWRGPLAPSAPGPFTASRTAPPHPAAHRPFPRAGRVLQASRRPVVAAKAQTVRVGPGGVGSDLHSLAPRLQRPPRAPRGTQESDAVDSERRVVLRK